MKESKQSNFVFQRKLVIIIDTKSFQIINFIDNKLILECFDQFQASDKVTIAKEEAYEKMKELIEFNPYYVYDFEQKQYVFCWRLSCQYGVHAATGEIILLSDL